MFAVIRRYRTREASAEEILQRVHEEFVPKLRAIDGFVSYYALSPAPGEIVSIGLFRDSEGVAESARVAAEWIHGNPWMAERSPYPPEVIRGEVKVHAEA